ncbi:MAG: two-component system response regulator CreB [Spirochaetes bacterium]|nr:two-component system response regulator CreB [Spirochaetota bacterium]
MDRDENQKKPVILIIEDESGIADTIAYSLSTEGFEARWVATGREGLEAAGSPVDLVILDIGLPDVSGFELLKELRRISPVPVLVLTARSEEIDRILGLELGADDYVVKPFSPRELASRVRAILRRTAPAPVEPCPSGTFTVDRNRRRIHYCGTPLSLSRYEYDILALFISRPGWVFSREKIMEIVWTEPEESLERTVDAHIKSLRNKMRAVRPDVDPIVTHRGVGYALREDL